MDRSARTFLVTAWYGAARATGRGPLLPPAPLLLGGVIAYGFGLLERALAVGVEDQATLDRLRALGCAGAHGYFVGPPVTADRLETWLAAPPRPDAGGEPDEALAEVPAMAPALNRASRRLRS